MNADMLRTMVEYHVMMNRKLWESVMMLTDEQYAQKIDYSNGSVQNHILHMVSVDNRWFARLRRVELPDRLTVDEYPDRAAIRAKWDEVEATIQTYVDALTDEQASATLTYRIGQRAEDTEAAWRVLMHVVNHGTNHRAQLLRALYDFGAPTFEQDIMILWWEQQDAAK